MDLTCYPTTLKLSTFTYWRVLGSYLPLKKQSLFTLLIWSMTEFEQAEIPIIMEKCHRLGKRSDFNILLQFLITLIGGFTILRPDILEKINPIVTYDYQVAIIVIPGVLFYLHIQFGYMLYNYHMFRKILDKRANDFHGDEPHKVQTSYQVFRESRMMELIYMVLKQQAYERDDIIVDQGIPQFKGSLYKLWSFIIISILAINHAITLVLISLNILEAYNYSTLLTIFLILLFITISILLFGSYRDYILLTKDQFFKRISIVIGISVPVLILFIWFLRGFIQS